MSINREDCKVLPVPISITSGKNVNVVGWVGKNSFVVFDESQQNQSEDIDRDEMKENLISLWDWAIINDISVRDFSKLQQSLETYIHHPLEENEKTNP